MNFLGKLKGKVNRLNPDFLYKERYVKQKKQRKDEKEE